jgi:hypothetical protein
MANSYPSHKIIQSTSAASTDCRPLQQTTDRAMSCTKYSRSIAILRFILALSRLFADAALYSTFVLSPRHQRRASSRPRTAQPSSRLPIVESPLTFSPYSSNGRIERFTKSNVLVQIERTAQNERRISGELRLDHSFADANGEHSSVRIADLWDILTDYDNLSTHVPNLVESRVIGGHVSNTKNYDYQPHTKAALTKPGPRIYQRGAQRIWGFEFGADLTMDMRERIIDFSAHDPTITKKCILDFKCVSSQFFAQFDGSWIVEETTTPSLYGTSKATTTTNVKYIVDVRPKGLVPVAALEWRIKEDVPTNMLGVVTAAVKRQKEMSPLDNRVTGLSNDFTMGNEAVVMDWYRDETLSMYL